MKLLHITAILSFSLAATPVFGATCSVSASAISLGSYTPNQTAPADSAGSIGVACTKGALDALPMSVTYSVEISRGGSSSFSPREMASGPNTLQYNLYRDAVRINVWGDASGGTASVMGSLQLQPSPGAATVTHTVYARIFAGQNAVPGAYADSIVVTINY